MTLTAMTAPLPVKAEVRILCKQLSAPYGFVAGILVLTMITIIIVTVWSTAGLYQPDYHLTPYPPLLGMIVVALWNTVNTVADTRSLGRPVFSSSCR